MPFSKTELPDTIPIIALRNCHLFPRCILPLYIYEPRYQDMVRYALAHDRMFSVATIRADEPEDSEEVYEESTAGLVRACVKQNDGTSHLILQGLRRIRFTGWTQEEPFRIATIEPIDEEPRDVADTAHLVDELLGITRNLLIEREQTKITAKLFDHLETLDNPGAVADVVSHNLVEDTELRQHLLAEPDPIHRLQWLVEHFTQELAD